MTIQANREVISRDLINRLNTGVIDCVLFDLDGVLIDSSSGIHAATNFTLTKLGYQERSLVEVKRYIGNPLPEMFEEFAPGAEWEIVRTYFRENSYSLIVDGSALTAFALETLTALHSSGFNLLIGSTKTSQHISGIIDRLQISRFFRGFVGGDNVPAKPAPDIFETVLQESRIDKTRTVVVGDTVNDVLAARAAGLQVVTIESELGDRSALIEDSADAHFSSLADFLQFMAKHSPLLNSHVRP